MKIHDEIVHALTLKVVRVLFICGLYQPIIDVRIPERENLIWDLIRRENGRAAVTYVMT